MRVEVVPEAHGDAGAGGLPRLALQEPGSWVGPAPAGSRVDVPAAQGLPESLQDKEGEGRAVEQPVRAVDPTSPGAGSERQGHLFGSHGPAALQGSQRLPGGEHVNAGRRGLQAQGC